MKCKGTHYEGGWPRNCYREAVQDGLCKPHLAGRVRSQKLELERDAKRAKANQFKYEMENLAESVGVYVYVNLDGVITIPADNLRKVVERLKAQQASQ